MLVITDDAGNEPAVTEVLTVIPGDPAAVLLSSDPSWVRAGRSSSITARVEDAFQNGVPGRQVIMQVAQGGGTLTADALRDTTAKTVNVFTGDDGEIAVTYLAAREAESALITATSGSLTADLPLETAMVDPLAAGGSLTNYPNPFHPDEAPTTIHYVLNDDATVRMRIYTLSGGLVLDQSFARGDEGGRQGHNTLLWDGYNNDNEPVASGGYILFIEAEGNGATMHVMRRKIGVVW